MATFSRCENRLFQVRVRDHRATTKLHPFSPDRGAAPLAKSTSHQQTHRRIISKNPTIILLSMNFPSHRRGLNNIQNPSGSCRELYLIFTLILLAGRLLGQQWLGIQVNTSANITVPQSYNLCKKYKYMYKHMYKYTEHSFALP